MTINFSENNILEVLLSKAKEAKEKAYCPYSNFSVGAAVLTEEGNIFTGCNVENVSYGLTICAERVAIFSAIASEGAGSMRVKAIAVVAGEDVPCSPCGACRQVIAEVGREAVVIFKGTDAIQRKTISELLPNAFEFDKIG